MWSYFTEKVAVPVWKTDINGRRGSAALTTGHSCPSVLQLLDTVNVATSLLIPSILMMEEVRSSEMSVLTRATRRHITEEEILHSHRRENLKSYIALAGWIP
jgi:hypothetical protein